eukprot:GHVN01066324.1.p2 GENE.GHVN01066324.1~~GHVN01066324.1.p2  ORF type:complete len:162 (-),score=28.38 GHVN01066324.1:143-628(-)
MDIQVSSNFERVMFELFNKDAVTTAQLYDQLREDQAFEVNTSRLDAFQQVFQAFSATDLETKEAVLSARKHNKIIDPHTGVALHCAKKYVESAKPTNPVVVLSTAHFGKFIDTMNALLPSDPSLAESMPKEFLELEQLTKRSVVLSGSVVEVAKFLEANCS